MSVVIMAWNEQQGLRPTVERTLHTLQQADLGCEVLIIDDGSSDDTGLIADQLAASDARVRVLHHGINQGLGAVWRNGLSQSRGTWVTFLPADGEVPPETVVTLMNERDNADLILGTLPATQRTPLALLLSYGERALIRALFGGFPRFQGGLAVHRKVLETVPIAMPAARGWMIVTELILRTQAAGFRITSVETRMAPRLGGASKVRNLRTVAANLRQLGELRLALWGHYGNPQPLRGPRED